jgi:large subunit ribosomal protein L17
LVTDLLRYERITTTEAKAKEIRPMAEKIITLAKRGDIHARRQALKFVFDPWVVKKTFDEIAPRMASRLGGYTRLTAVEQRKGDGAKMAVIELMDFLEMAPESGADTAPQAVSKDLAEVTEDSDFESVDETAAEAETDEELSKSDDTGAAGHDEDAGFEPSEDGAAADDSSEESSDGEEETKE